MSTGLQIMVLGIVLVSSVLYLIYSVPAPYSSPAKMNEPGSLSAADKADKLSLLAETSSASTTLGVADPRMFLERPLQPFSPDEEFRGPTEKPHIIGPSGNPPNY